MKLILALRLFSEWHAKAGIEAPTKAGVSRGQLLNIHVERRHPALNNITQYLARQGRLPSVRQGEMLRQVEEKKVVERTTDCRLYWCEIETDLPISYWESAREVELVLPREDFDRFALSIRGRAGTAYIEACDAFARGLSVKASEFSGYVPPKTARSQAA